MQEKLQKLFVDPHNCLPHCRFPSRLRSLRRFIPFVPFRIFHFRFSPNEPDLSISRFKYLIKQFHQIFILERPGFETTNAPFFEFGRRDKFPDFIVGISIKFGNTGHVEAKDFYKCDHG